MENLVLLLGILFVISLQPVFMLSSLILITISYSFYIYSFLGGFWFSYILLMVMLSGVLVVFTYMVTMIPNESFEVYNLLVILGMFVSVILSFNLSFYNNMSLVSMNLWLSFIGMINLFFLSFLLVMMMLVVKMSYLGEGAFRME